jgi:hypothetical protein
LTISPATPAEFEEAIVPGDPGLPVVTAGVPSLLSTSAISETSNSYDPYI